MNRPVGNIYIISVVVLIMGALYLSGGFIQNQVNSLKYGIQSLKVKISPEEIQTFQEQLHALEFKSDLLEEENNVLRMQLEAPLPPDIRLLPARVVGNSRFLYIDQGERSGIKIGSGVVSQEVLVGVVVEVATHTSKIMLLTDPESKIPVKTQRAALGLIVGGDNKLLITRILQDYSLDIDDLVGTSGDQVKDSLPNIPGGLLIGRVSKIIKDNKEVYQQAEISPSIDYKLLTHVFVVR